jgi:DNA polymerase epsilon subunit 2
VLLYRERFHLLAQRLARNRHFSRPALRAAAAPPGGGAGGGGLCELTPLQALLGSTGQTRFVLGCLSQLDDGRFSLEDATGCVPVDLSAAATSDGLFAENCVVVAEGELRRDGVFEARALGFPPAEPRAESAEALAGFDLFGAGLLRADAAAAAEATARAATSEAWVVLADVFADRPPVLAALAGVLSYFETSGSPPALILLMGDFCSGGAAAPLAEHAACFARLADTLRPFTTLRRCSRFAFLPGPGDVGPAAALPRPPLPASLTRPLRGLLPSAHFLSCPARLRWHADTVVFSRDDVAGRLRRACVRPPADAPRGSAAGSGEDQARAAADRLFGHLCATLVQQSHLAPLPLQHAPVLWEHDGALWLYPTPHALLLADRSAHPAQLLFEDCACMNTVRRWRGAAQSPAPHSCCCCRAHLALMARLRCTGLRHASASSPRFLSVRRDIRTNL